MKLRDAVTEGSGAVNEDGFGLIERQGEVSAAWVFDGVTGINGRNFIPAGTDAAWLVDRAHGHLLDLAAADLDLAEILQRLVMRLVDDWATVSATLDLPTDYDPPAACLILAKRYGSQWRALRLGDSCLLAEAGDGALTLACPPEGGFDQWLAGEARRRRDQGEADTKALLAEFRPQLKAARARRNQPGGYSVLECSAAALAMPEYLDLGAPARLLLCTDGYYRAVDHYGLHDAKGLVDASFENVRDVLAQVRRTEAGDPQCLRYVRFKPADDATAVMLSSPQGDLP